MNPTSATSGASGLVGSLNRPKMCNVQKVVNGYMVACSKTDSYEMEQNIAATLEDVSKILTDYLSA